MNFVKWVFMSIKGSRKEGRVCVKFCNCSKKGSSSGWNQKGCNNIASQPQRNLRGYFRCSYQSCITLLKQPTQAKYFCYYGMCNNSKTHPYTSVLRHKRKCRVGENKEMDLIKQGQGKGSLSKTGQKEEGGGLEH